MIESGSRDAHLSRTIWRRGAGASLALVAICLGTVLGVVSCNSKSSTPLPPVTRPAQPLSQLKLTAKTAGSGVNSVYRNGRESEHHAILESLGGGLGVLDFDNDELPDMFCLGGGYYTEEPAPAGLPSSLCRNLGGWRFTDVTAAAGVGKAPYYSHGCAVGDFNSDGFSDLLVTGYNGLQLFQNQGDGTFQEVSKAVGMTDTLWSSSAGWGDLNADGFLDLYVVHYTNWSFNNDPKCPAPDGKRREICSPRLFDPLPDTVYYSNGDGTFYDATKQAKLRPDGKGLGVLLADLDHDGDLDVYVANDTVDNFLYLNDGKGELEEVGLINGGARNGTGSSDGSMGVDLGDYNGDLLPDLWVSNFELESFALYRNESAGQFLHVSQAAGVTALGRLYVGFGTAFIDLDRDGDEDIVATNGHVVNFPRTAPVLQEPLVLINNRATFHKDRFPESEYFGATHRGRGLTVADFDRDGDQDLAISHNDDEPMALISNESPTKNGWLRVRLVGRSANRDAVGARLVLHTSSGDQLRHVRGGGSYLSQMDLAAFWGVPAGATIAGLTIDWPDGVRQELASLASNQSLTVIQPLRDAQ